MIFIFGILLITSILEILCCYGLICTSNNDLKSQDKITFKKIDDNKNNHSDKNNDNDENKNKDINEPKFDELTTDKILDDNNDSNIIKIPPQKEKKIKKYILVPKITSDKNEIPYFSNPNIKPTIIGKIKENGRLTKIKFTADVKSNEFYFIYCTIKIFISDTVVASKCFKPEKLYVSYNNIFDLETFPNIDVNKDENISILVDGLYSGTNAELSNSKIEISILN